MTLTQTSLDQSTYGNQQPAVGGTLQPHASSESRPIVAAHEALFPAAKICASTTDSARRGSFLRDPVLALLSDSLDDIEQLRIATENRYRMLTRTEVDSDGEYRGLGLTPEVPSVARVAKMLDNIRVLEHQAALDLQRQLRASPLRPWVLREKGVGEKQAARLLAAIGDPYWNDLHARPRTVSELWAYAGYAVHDGRADRRRKGVQGNWSAAAKTRTYLVAESCMKARTGGHYRDIYEEARAQYADATHPHDCIRCGPAGQPALAGTPLSAGHQHARALRLVAKEILRDLWIEAKTIHEGAQQ